MHHILEEVKELLRKEASAILKLSERLDDRFEEAVKLINSCGKNNKIILIGVGKSRTVAQKFASTLSTIGKPAIFLHPTEALHGELGVISKDDLIVIISNSGKTDEILSILPWLKMKNNKILAITADNNSELAKHADVVLDTATRTVVTEEIVPTISIISAFAIVDALTTAIIKLNNISINDLFCFHPRGSIGKGSILKVKDIMHINEAIPRVYPHTKMQDVLFEMTSKGLGMTAVVNERNELVGIITDGDLRRLIEKKQNENIWRIPAEEVMTKKPKTVDKEASIIEALQKMKENKITSLLIVNDSNKLIGALHMHSILRRL